MIIVHYLKLIKGDCYCVATYQHLVLATTTNTVNLQQIVTADS